MRTPLDVLRPGADDHNEDCEWFDGCSCNCLKAIVAETTRAFAADLAVILKRGEAG